MFEGTKAMPRPMAGCGPYLITMVSEPSDVTESSPPQTEVDVVIDQLDRRLIGGPDRSRLRKSLDKADAPLSGRAGQDQAVGKAIRLVK